MKSTYITGLNGEQTAEKWLQQHRGMKTLERRYRNKAGEIDLIMKDKETIVFVEVKTRLNSSPGTGMLAVDRKKQQRLARCAVLYLMETGLLKSYIRFDVAEVSETSVIHVPDAFQPGTMFYR